MKDLVNVPRNRQGWTSLHYAVKNGNVGKINDLIKGGKMLMHKMNRDGLLYIWLLPEVIQR